MTLRARQALLADEKLGPLNLGISVRSGVCTLWGKVASQELAQKALERVRQIAGVLEVRSEIHVEPGVGGHAAVPSKPALTVDGSRSAPPTEARVPEWVPPPTRLTSRPETPAGPLVSLLAPVPLVAAPVQAEPPAGVLGPSHPRETDSVSAGVQGLLRGEIRYWGVQPEVAGGVVHLRGRTVRWEDLYELAGKVSKLPGVQRVIVDQSRR